MTSREVFEAWMENGATPLRRGTSEQYVNPYTSAAWAAWQAATAAERERCAKIAESMHPEDRPDDYAWAIRTEWSDDAIRKGE